MESEHQLQSVYGSKRPFSVPDDYFFRLPSRIMAQLPKEKSAAEKPYRVLVRRLRPLAAAAMTVGVVLTGFLAYSMFLSPKEGSMTGTFSRSGTGKEQTVTSQDGFDEAADYLMMDEDDMYAYMADD